MPKAGTAERRTSARRQVNQPLVLVVDSEASQLTSGAFALDLSELGARLRAKIHLEPGQVITVIPGSNSGSRVKSRVVWVNDEGEGCAAGVAFLEPIALERFSTQTG
ncbi:MAG TPA: PilZ domain-containing protein [Terriglobia bacterium]|nr:PilZ domain-containing protein [Terriglobia bacterium]